MSVVDQSGSVSMPVKRPKSVVLGHDIEVIETLLAVHCPVQHPLILDCTHNDGKFWKHSVIKPTIRMDLDRSFPIDVVADFEALPLEAASVDVIVFDPPHLPTNAASEHSSLIWERRYGITSSGNGREGDNVNGMFAGFLREAKRVLKPNAIVLAKVADLIHNHRYQWQHFALLQAAFDAGMTPCDLVVKSDPNAGHIQSSKWKNVKHVCKNHCYWTVIRNSSRCEC